MKIIKNIIKFASSALFLTTALAAPIPNPLPAQFDSIPAVINWASSFVLPLATIALVGVVIYAGFIKLSSIGDPEKEKKYMETLTSGIVGYILVISASLVVSIFGALLGIRLLGVAQT